MSVYFQPFVPSARMIHRYDCRSSIKLDESFHLSTRLSDSIRVVDLVIEVMLSW